MAERDVGGGRWSLIGLSPVWRASFRSHARHPALAVLAIVGIALGVAVTVAIALANRAAREAFADSVTEVVGNATHQIVAGSAGLDERDYPALRAAIRARGGQAAPVIDAEVALVDQPGQVVRLLGIDPFAERPFRARTAAFSGGDVRIDRLLTEPGTALAANLPVGLVRIRHGTRFAVLDITARLASTTTATKVIAVDIATAQEVLGCLGRLDRIDVILPDGAESLPLPPGADLVPAARRGEALQQLTAAFHTNLTALGLIALVVGMFLVANTASFAVVRRRELFARLRAHGATPGQIVSLVLGEVALAGFAASFLGVVAGSLLAQLLIRLVSRTIGDLYVPIAPLLAMPAPTVLLQGVLLGTLASVLAAIVPAREAACIVPRLGLLRSAVEANAVRSAKWLVVLAAVGGLAGGAVLWLLPGIVAGFSGLGLLLVAAAALVPVLTVPLTRVLGWPWRQQPLAALAVRAIAVNRSRTGLAVAALSIACAAALGMTLMVSSFRTALTTWLATTLTADVYVSAPRLIAARVGDQPLAPDLVARILAVPGIRSVISKRDTIVPVGLPDGRLLDVTVAAFAPLPDSRQQFPARPAFANEAARNAAWDAFANGAAFVTEPFAAKQRVRTGDRLQLRTPSGNREVVIAAVLVEYSSDQGYVYVDLAQYRAWFNDQAVTALALNADVGVNGEELATRVRQVAGDVPLAVTPGATLKSASLTVFDRTFAITAVIRWLAAGVAVLGLIGALAAVQLERARTTARLRALGLTPRGVIGRATAECLLTGTAAGLLAVPIGIGVAAGLTHVINRRSFGWSMDLTIDPWQLILTVLLAAGAAGVAGLLPAYRASRVRIAEALHEE